MPKRTCAQCGESFIVQSPGEYIYKKRGTGAEKGRTLFFCTRGCQRKYTEAHPGRKEYNRWGRT